MNDTKKVTTKWQVEGNLAVIYRIDDLLCYYTKQNDPHFKLNQEVTQGDVDKKGLYKVTLYEQDNLPSDAFVDLTFNWGG